MLKVFTVEALSDNYSYILYHDDTNEAIVIDAPDSITIINALEKLNKKLSHLLITHHHYDHTQGIQKLKECYNCQVIAPKQEQKLIPSATKFVEEGSLLKLLESEIQIFETPGHTLGHLVYYFPKEAFLFSGDALFSLGCGRLFEGSASQMYQGLEKIKALPKKVQIFFGHEYTKSNLDFSLSLLPDDPALSCFKKAFTVPSTPTTLSQELDCNLFLRVDSEDLREALNFKDEENEKVFAALRNRKDSF